MIAIDTDILVYAARTESPSHAASFALVQTLAEGSSAWAIPWPCIHEFLAVVTSGRFYEPPTPLMKALEQVGEWLASPSLVVLAEGGGHFAALRAVLAGIEIRGTAIHDAKIAAICVANGVTEFWSADRGFGRFSALKMRNPLST